LRHATILHYPPSCHQSSFVLGPRCIHRPSLVISLSFLADLIQSGLITNPPHSLDSLLDSYDSTLTRLIDNHAPLITKLSCRQSPSQPWFNSSLLAARRSSRQAESKWKATHSASDRSLFSSLRNRYHKLILSAKKTYYSTLVNSATNCRQRWNIINSLLHRTSSAVLPSSISLSTIADRFASFCTDKISRLRCLFSVTSLSFSTFPAGRFLCLQASN